MQNVQSALQTLRKAATKGKTKKSLLENIENLSSSIVLLVRHIPGTPKLGCCQITDSSNPPYIQNSSSPSPQAFNKLASLLRAPIIPLYSNYVDPALIFSATVFEKVVKEGIRPCLLEGNNQKDVQCGWEKVANSLLSGVIVRSRSCILANKGFNEIT